MLATLGLSIGGLMGLAAVQNHAPQAQAASFVCSYPEILDGDTIDCGATRVRLQGIDAPELPGHCRPGRDCAPGDPYVSTEHLRAIIGDATLQCRKTDIDRYGRSVARCSAGETDLSCAQLDGGQAIRRYGMIWC